jgi:DNA-binding response OmpR family regulator/anti-sigma regulatory factor (Ser/Thr protein kinase)
MTPETHAMKLGDMLPGKAEAQRPKILIIDDDSVTRRLLRQQVHILGYDSMEATNGRQGMDLLRSNPGGFNAVLLDRSMPEMDGMEVVHQMKKDAMLCKIPIIMQTSKNSPDEVKEGIDAGVFYYLTKPIDSDLLKSVIRAAVSDNRQTSKVKSSVALKADALDLMQSATFTFRTVEEAENLAIFLSGAFPEPDRVVMGLTELMVNAIEHGNLGIGYEQKAQLCQYGRWHDEIEKRLNQPGREDVKAELSITRKDGGIYIVITDQGEGFDWKNYLKINPTRAGDAHGRGIAMANSISFDKLTYNDKGNKAVAYVADTSALQW